MSATEKEKLITELTKQMKDAAKSLEFEKAAALRDQMADIEKKIDLLKRKK